jgi:E3 ubiquitin-protein ligase TRIP12
MLLTKVPEEYKPAFQREGVFHEIEALASRNLIVTKSKDKDKDKDKEPKEPAPAVTPLADLTPNVGAPIPVPVVPTPKKSSSSTLDPEDAVTLRARVIRFKFLEGMANAGDGAMKELNNLVEQLSLADASEDRIEEALNGLASLFATSSVSSFELIQSGAVGGLLSFSTDEGRKGMVPLLVVVTANDVPSERLSPTRAIL